jgi:hypothetical protein
MLGMITDLAMELLISTLSLPDGSTKLALKKLRASSTAFSLVLA